LHRTCVTGFQVEFELPPGNLRGAIVKAQIIDYRPVDTDVSVSLVIDNRASFFCAVLGKNCYDDDDVVANMVIMMIEARFFNGILMDNAYDVRVNVPNIHHRYVEHPARGQNVLANFAGAVNDNASLAKNSKVELEILVGPTEAKEAFFGGISQLHLKPCQSHGLPESGQSQSEVRTTLTTARAGLFAILDRAPGAICGKFGQKPRV